MNPILRATLWMSGALLSFTAMAVAGRELGAHYDTFEIMLYRSVFGLLIVCVLATVFGKLHEFRTDILGTHLLRNLVHFTGQNLWFYAVTAIPLAQVFALEFTTPLWVIVLSPLLLGERLTPIKALAAGMGFVGILIVARPGSSEINAGTLTAASCAIFFAFTFILTKRLTKTQSTTTIMFYLTATQLIFGLIAVGYDGQIALPDAANLPMLALVGTCGLLAHFCIVNALSIAPATIVAPIDFARLPVIAVVAMLLYGEPLEIWVFAGAVIIFAGNYLNIWTETRKSA